MNTPITAAIIAALALVVFFLTTLRKRFVKLIVQTCLGSVHLEASDNPPKERR